MANLLALYMRLTAPRRPSWYAIPLRLIVGCGFIEHGYAKLARGPDSFTAILHALGMPVPALFAWATVVVELLGGFAVLIGAFIPIASVPMTIVVLVAIFTVHLPNGFSSIKLQSVDAAGAHFGQPGYETDLLYIAALLAMLLGGSGPLALYRLLLRRFAVMEPSAFGFQNGSGGRPSDAELAKAETRQTTSFRGAVTSS
jgi:putative oxidoreductase